ncbi:helix-turn-helix domain-containing protein [Weissella paramesenteroides]|uniref:helix-turn-helix domain-containing protein n=1 Tax=Weissella paramesenteroides TaxID=1249 RepID=UPI0039822695
MTTYERIQSAAKKRGMNLREVAKSAGLKSETAIYRYNQGVTPRESTLRSIADVLNVSVDYLLGKTDEMHVAKNEDPSTPELIAAHWGIDLSDLSDEEKGFVMGRAQGYVKGLVDAIEGRK